MTVDAVMEKLRGLADCTKQIILTQAYSEKNMLPMKPLGNLISHPASLTIISTIRSKRMSLGSPRSTTAIAGIVRSVLELVWLRLQTGCRTNGANKGHLRQAAAYQSTAIG